MKVFSTFTGIGGFEVGIENAHKIIGGEPLEFVGYSEIDKHAVSVYEKQFGGVKNYGDITKINESELPDFDCIVGGFPCQAFSIAGRRGGFADTRGTLFFDLARILRAKQPRCFVFENVKGLLNHDGGNTIKTIITTLDELGYDLQWQVVNSKDHGVPQNRERIIIVGHIRGTRRPEIFPIIGAGCESDSKIKVTGILNSETWQKRNDSIRRVYGTDGIAPTIPTGTGGGVMPKIELKIPEATKQGFAVAGIGDAINIANVGSKTRRGTVSPISQTIKPRNQIHTIVDDRHNVHIKGPNDVSRTVRTSGTNSSTPKHNWDSIDDGVRIRRLTPVECERLQAFPDDWTKFGLIQCSKKNHKDCESDSDDHMVQVEISDTQRYKMCGNAVTTNVIQAVFERLFASYAQEDQQ